VDCVITDPPYGVDYGGGRGEQDFSEISNDTTTKDAVELFQATLPELKRILKSDGHLYVFARWDTYPEFKTLIEGVFEVSNCLVWAKNNWGMGHDPAGFRPQHEFIIYARGEDARPLNEQESDLLEYKRAKGGKYDHPTQKPVSLVSHLSELSTETGETILDPFMGSGTTAVAAIQNDRDYVGFEIDEDNYRDVIERRIGEAKRQVEANQRDT